MVEEDPDVTGEGDPDVTRDGSGAADGPGATAGTGAGGPDTGATRAARPGGGRGTGAPDDGDSDAADTGDGADDPESQAGPADPATAAPGTPEATDATTEPADATAAERAAAPADPEPADAATTATADTDTADTDASPADAATPGPRPKRRRRRLRLLALAAALLVLATAGTGWWLYQRLDANIRTDVATAKELAKHEAERPVSVVRDARNILLIGSDSRGGTGNGKYGQDSGTQRSDTTILLHLAADRESATAVSIPRDLMVDIPACRSTTGTEGKAQQAQFNWAYQFGGAACTIRTVEKLTGIRIDHHMIVDFSGFKRMVDAVDGVEVCLDEPVDDAEAHLRLPAGRQTLDGEDALGYVRARYSMGDGSDTSRMARQQEFLGSLLKKVRSNGVLFNPTRLYPVLDAATSSLTTDPGLGSLRKLYSLTQDIRDVPEDRIRFMTVPRQPYALNPNRDELVQPDADRLFRQLRLDLEVSPATGGEDGETLGPDSPSSSPKTPGTPGTPGTPETPGSARTARSPEAPRTAGAPAPRKSPKSPQEPGPEHSSLETLATTPHGICG
ncbi:LCP family protein [Streptomyces sp. NPDC018031]|uniref:LCP family protein n=1 Tax=Streptomyces sp. NPDC018031 TaxID=3365033 RepID=UPI00379E11D9